MTELLTFAVGSALGLLIVFAVIGVVTAYLN